MRRALGLVTALTLFAIAENARAGGIETPDNGTEALGRGGAFTAKADDPTAIYHNVAGLAQQRGTRLLVNANMSYSSMSFQREGVYPGDPATQPYAGKPFPRADSQGGVTTIPFLAVTSDFGLENVTFALGTFAPPAMAGGKVYPLTNPDGTPSPVRHDAIGGTSSIVLYHTAAVGFRIGEHLELGGAAHLVQFSIGERVLDNTDSLGPSCKPENENPVCEARVEANMKTWTGTGSLGAILRPTEDTSIGLHVRGPTMIRAEGDATFTAPSKASKLKLEPTAVFVKTALPAVFRLGARKTFGPLKGRRNPQPTADLEVDATYELWGEAMNPGPELTLQKVFNHKGPLKRVSERNYNNTFSLRAGGSLTPDWSVPVTLRGGVYYDSSATSDEYTSLSTDTLDKFALTVGAGLRFNAWHVDVAYASVFDITRTVESGAKKTANTAAPQNNGVYSGSTQIFSLGATIELDEVFGLARLPSLKRGEQVARR